MALSHRLMGTFSPHPTASAFWTTGRLCRRDPVGRSCRCPVPGDLTVRTLFSGVSRGTEALVFRGGVPDNQAQIMRAPFQDGQFPWPVKYGYAAVGEVIDGPEDRIGRRVFVLVSPPIGVRGAGRSAAVDVPAAVPDRRAVLAANMETAVNALWDAAPGIGDRIAVVGAGTVGCLIAWLASRLPGSHVKLIDVDPSQGPGRGVVGGRFRGARRRRGRLGRLGRRCVPCQCDVIAGWPRRLGLAGDEATVLEASWYGDTAAYQRRWARRFIRGRLTLRSTQVGRVSPSHRPRWSHRRRLALALSLVGGPGPGCAFDRREPI